MSRTWLLLHINNDKGYRDTDIDIEYGEEVKEFKEDSAIIQFKNIPAVKQALC